MCVRAARDRAEMWQIEFQEYRPLRVVTPIVLRALGGAQSIFMMFLQWIQLPCKVNGQSCGLNFML